MTITQHTRRRVFDAIPPKGAPLRELSAASGIHISNVRTIFKLLVEEGKAFSLRAGTGENSKHEVWLFTTEAAREEFEESWLGEVSRRQKARLDEKAARRKAEREAQGRSLVAVAAARREARKRAERERAEAQRLIDDAKRSAKQAKLRKETAAAGATNFKAGTLSPKPKKSAWADMPAHIPDGLDPIELPNTLGNRFAPAPDEVPLCFRSLRPGQYLDEAPKPWVQAVA